MANIIIKDAVASDAETIIHFIRELAIYEKAEHEVAATADDIRASLFDPHTTTQAVLCYADDNVVGFAVFFLNYSTWLAKNGLYLEDLYVSPDFRGIGAGKALLHHLAGLAVAKDCGRFEWSVLDWNTPAIEFYQSIGAKPLTEWVGYRLAGEALIQFAKSPL
ncbi:GNAT family N-acetyltransferase [Thalassotalea sp. Y01]|uniref:GNAT family N-acetyltransferase n=1 Tax=Thalassotalea sp. Y01 TaxID=2729613 RepID=UPI00145D100D|nr:GNAT family N-acetyltransferase [Thalassotalea sp. Y01]